MAGTKFSAVYDTFLASITDDLYMELTPEDTLKDLQNLLLKSIPGFEFPRTGLEFELITKVVTAPSDGDFILHYDEDTLEYTVDQSSFVNELSQEEINILALLMKQSWVQRQVSSIEVTRQKYTGSDWKMTSQANHLSRLMALLSTAKTESFHMQRLYCRRKKNENGTYASRMSILRENSVL